MPKMQAGRDLTKLVANRKPEDYGKITGLYVKLNTLYEDVTFLSKFMGVETTNKDGCSKVYNLNKRSDAIILANNFELYNGFPVPNKNSAKNGNSLGLLIGFGCGEEVAIPEDGIQLTLLDRYMYHNKELFVLNVGHFDITMSIEQLDILSHYYACRNFTVRHGKNITINLK